MWGAGGRWRAAQRYRKCHLLIMYAHGGKVSHSITNEVTESVKSTLILLKKKKKKEEEKEKKKEICYN